MEMSEKLCGTVAFYESLNQDNKHLRIQVDTVPVQVAALNSKIILLVDKLDQYANPVTECTGDENVSDTVPDKPEAESTTDIIT